MDFTLKIYQNLLQHCLQNHYQFLTFYDYINKLSGTKTLSSLSANSTTQQLNNSSAKLLNSSTSPSKPLNFSTSKLLNISTPKLIILRHDVDRLPANALQTAMIEHELGIKGTYYFRTVPESYDLEIMEKIAKLGHEIGYHYEDVDLVSSKQKSVGSMQYAVSSKKGARYSSFVTRHLIDMAYESFCKNMEMLRKNFDIKTICMHGSPRSKYDNKLIWSKHDYRELGIIGEPYFDIDFTEFAYYTDTGRRWDGDAVSVRDKVGGIQRSEVGGQKSVGSRQYAVNSKEGERVTRHASRVTANWPRFRKTMDMIKAIEEGRFPQKAMITVHPQRWTDDPFLWGKELVWQNVKNAVKYFIVHKNSLGV